MIKQDILEKQAKSSYLAIGSNLGDRFANIQLVEKLLVLNNIYINDTSSYYETPSWPNRKFPKFFNIVLKIKTDMSLIGLFKTVKKIEKKVGRIKALKNHPRICDIDIIDFNGINLNIEFKGQNIETPHPKMHRRNFVIFPLYELNKNWIHPKTKVNINHIINQFKGSELSDIRIV